MVECLESANSATCREADLTECGLSRGRRIALDVEASDTIDNVIDAGHFELINFAAQPYHVAIITPVIHYCMGGLEIDENSAVLGSDSETIRGLYAAACGRGRGARQQSTGRQLSLGLWQELLVQSTCWVTK